ncbi:hypothetical protein Egran_02423 [Elaphomyces granulatus]|uniref:Integrase core domain-containing protein n=1 Tax=Elaphomyces granulatus TaxID=519963 RepID=A0A232M0G6_9EURO|nr:hypothetical protein Egran_02423 [Elaphomyces granulatus]
MTIPSSFLNPLLEHVLLIVLNLLLCPQGSNEIHPLLQPNALKSGNEYITPPDWLWCCDGHDKFRNFGIEIYACVDAYSRRIQWCYVGNSNRRDVSILRQVVAMFQKYGHCPRFFRSDRGKEVLLLLLDLSRKHLTDNPL